MSKLTAFTFRFGVLKQNAL